MKDLFTEARYSLLGMTFFQIATMFSLKTGFDLWSLLWFMLAGFLNYIVTKED